MIFISDIYLFQDLISVGFKAPEWTAEYLISSGIPKTSKILDCAAGSGLVAEILREKYGFTGHIDALDGSQEMLDKAEVKNVYNGLICSYIGDGNVIPVEDSKSSSLVRNMEICRS